MQLYKLKVILGTNIPAAWQQPQETETNEGANELGTPRQITETC